MKPTRQTRAKLKLWDTYETKLPKDLEEASEEQKKIFKHLLLWKNDTEGCLEKIR